MLNVLLIEDQEDDALLMSRALERGGFQPAVERVDSELRLRNALGRTWDVILCDYSIPGFSGLRAIEIIREQDAEVPVIVVSGTIGEETAVDAVRAGANDYLLKSSLTRLVPAVRRALTDSDLRRLKAKLASELDRSERRFRVTFEQAPIGIALIDPQRQLVEVNGYLARMLGYDSKDLLGRPVSSLTVEGEKDSTLHLLARVDGGAPAEVVEKRYIRRDGSHVLGRTTISFLEGDHEPHYLLIVEDISAQRESERRLHLQARMLDRVEQAVIACEIDGRIVYTNEFVEKLYGFPHDALIGSNMAETGAWRAPMNAPAEISARIRSGATWSGEVELRRADGTTFPGWVTDSPITDDGGSTIGMVSVSHDLTDIKSAQEDRRRAETELRRAAEAQMVLAQFARDSIGRTAMDVLQDAARVAQRQLRVETCSFYMLDAGGTTLGFAAGQPLKESTVPADSTTPIGRALAAGGTLVFNDPAADDFSGIPDLAGPDVTAGLAAAFRGQTTPPGVLMVFTSQRRAFQTSDAGFVQSLADVVAESLERDAAQRALMASEERYRTVVEGASEVIYTVDIQGLVTSLNPAFRRVTGWPTEAWIGRPFGPLVAEEDRERATESFQAIINGQRLEDLDVGLRSIDGGTISLRISAAPMWKDGRIVGVLGFARDVTQSKRAEAERDRLEHQLAQAMRLTSLGRLAATIAHEFNNVLMGISPFVELLQRQGADPERRAAALEHIGGAIARGRHITEEILRYTRPVPPILEPIPVAAVRQLLLTGIASGLPPTCGLHVNTPDPALAILADAGQLHQILSNLILNARDAMAGEGTISISLERPRAGEEYAFGVVTNPERYVRITVADTGSGIAPEILSHIFEPLFTTKRTGTGLGLAVTHQVVEQHGGEIFVESSPGGGSAFHIFLPAADASAKEGDRRPPPEVRLPAQRILIVEDDPHVAAGVTLMFEEEGWDVALVTTGADVMPALDRRRPDVVLLDIGLPDKEGTLVYREIADAYPDLPVVFSTGHGDERTIEGAREGGHVAVLLKPYSMGTLLETIERVQRAARGR